MKQFCCGFLSLLFASNLFASNLCDVACDLSITFPDGGSIKAKGDLTIIFGEGGFVNNGSSTIAYSAGEKLKLDNHKAINFRDGGVFEIGIGGNIKYRELEIKSNGKVELAAVGGDKLVTIDKLTLKEEVAFNISSDFEVIDRGSLQNKEGLITATSSLTFVNKGYVKGYFHFGNAILTYNDNDDDEKSAFELFFEKIRGGTTTESQSKVETQNISGTVYIKTDRQFTVVSKLQIIEPAEEPADVVGNGAATNDTATNDTAGNANAGASDGTGIVINTLDNVNQPDALGQADTATNTSVSVASAGGWVNQFSLLSLFALMVMIRLQSIARNNTLRRSNSDDLTD